MQPSLAQQSHWQHIPVDPTEEFFDRSKETAQAKGQLIPDSLPCLPATRNLFAESATVKNGLVKWGMGKLVDLSTLWGSEKGENEPSYKEEMAIQRERRREKGYRLASPPTFSNNNSIPSMVDVMTVFLLPVCQPVTFPHSRVYNFPKEEEEAS